MTQLDVINQELKNLEVGKTVMEYINDPRYNKLSTQRSTLQTIDEMKKLPKGTKLYFVSVRFSQTYTGNHESFDVYYIKDNEMIKVWMPVHMKRQRGMSTSQYLWVCHGGNYSFTQHIVDSISYAVHDESGWFKDVRL